MKRERQKMHGGIQRKITFLICSVSVIVVSLTIGPATWWIHSLILNGIKEKQSELTQTLSYAINQMIDQKVQEFRIHAGNSMWKEAIAEANLRYASMSQEAILREMREMDEKWIPAKPDSAFIRDHLATPLSIRFRELADDDPDVAEIFVTDRFGGLVAASGKTSDFYQADEAWWQKAYAGGRGHIFIGDVELDQSSGVLSIPMAIPVKDNEGHVIGIVKESIGVDVLFAPLKNYKAGRTGHASLIDAKGNIIFHEGMKPLSEKLFDDKEIHRISKMKNGSLKRVEEAGEEIEFTSFQRLDNPHLLSDGITWYVCVSQNAEEIFLPLKSLGIGMAILLLMILPGVVFLGIMVGNRFAVPINKLKIATENVMDGRWDHEIKIQTGDEIQTFAESFNYMMRHLHERQEQLQKAKEEIEVLSQGLEEKVEERTRELSESQIATMNILEDLTSAKEELEMQSWGLQKANDGIRALYQELEAKNLALAKLDRLKDDFVSIVAHELRNPLGVVREAAALILDGLVGPVEEEQKKYIEIIKRTGDRLIHITNDLLDLAKIESGKIVVNFEPMDLLSLARQAGEGIALRARKKGITISEDLPDGKLEIMGDFDKLLQVMTNLLTNAFKFTEKGGITVEVRDLGKEVRCAVKDTGPGISKENLPRLFSKFEQFGKPASPDDKGSGLGLVISKSIVGAHGGRIWAESEPGKGSSFIFTLPKQQQKHQQKLGEILMEEKILTPDQLAQALRKQGEQKT